MKDLFDLPQSIINRDQAIATVSVNSGDWFNLAILQVNNWSAEWKMQNPLFSGEDVRRWITPNVGCPHSPNVWGALINKLVRNKTIIETGVYVKMKDVKSNARRTPQYTWGKL